MGSPKNQLTDEHMSATEKAILHEWEKKILIHLAVTPNNPTGVLALQPIVVKDKADVPNYYNAINWLRDRGWIDHHTFTPGVAANEIAAMQINRDGLAELQRRGVSL